MFVMLRPGTNRRLFYTLLACLALLPLLFLWNGTFFASSSSFSPFSPSSSASSLSNGNATRLELQENYPGSCHLDPFMKVDNVLAGYTASGYVHSDQPHQARFQWKVHAAETQSHTLELRYSSSLSQALSFSLLLNWRPVSQLHMEATHSSWRTVLLSATLQTGVNSLVLHASSENKTQQDLSGFLIDSLTIHPHNQPSLPLPLPLPLLLPVECHNNQRVAMLQPNPRCVAGAVFRDETVDCGGARVGISCTGDQEDQPAVITLQNASLKNLRLAADGGADGIHCDSGDCTLENVVWEDICEDAATQAAEGGTMTIKGGWAFNGKGGWGDRPDKIFQHNSKNSKVIVTGGFTAKGHNGALYRSCGNCMDNGGPRFAHIEDVRVEGMVQRVAGVNWNYGDKATIRNMVMQQEDHPACFEYFGVDKTLVDGKNEGQRWMTKVCDVSPGDVKTLDTIHVVVAVNKEYQAGLLALLRSIGKNTPHPQAVMVHVILCNKKDGEGGEDALWAVGQEILCEGCPPVEVTVFHLEKSIKEKLNNKYREELNEESNYARLFLHVLFPSLKKVIWLDSDTLALGDLRELWHTPMNGEDTSLAAVPQADKPLKSAVNNARVKELFKSRYGKKRYDSEEATYNAGVFMADLEKWRSRKVEEEFLWWIEQRNKEEDLWMFATQPLLIVVFHGQWQQLGQEWNVIDLGWRNDVSEESIQSAKVLHWNGERKPWLPSAFEEYKKIWDEYYVHYKTISH
ncbi:Pectate lyase [Balamuthia mandrillaris]